MQRSVNGFLTAIEVRVHCDDLLYGRSRGWNIVVDPMVMNALAGPRVVIVGGGFGGLEATKALRRAAVQITLIDRQNHHCFQPLLYQVATAALSPADIAWPIRSILSGQENVRVVMGDVVAIDRPARLVRTAAGHSYNFDYLVLATGATHSYFGHDDWAHLAPGLKHISDAVEIRRRILLAFERAEVEVGQSERARLLTFAIIGGGPTGVELAGAIADMSRGTLARDFRAIDPALARIVLLEAGPRLLAAFPERLARYAQESLSRMGVEVRTSTAVIGCDELGLSTAAGRLEATTMIWAAGVKGSAAGRWLDADTDRTGRIVVGPELSLRGDPTIFIIGDTADVTDASGAQVPGIAPAAKQMGHYVGRLIASRTAGARACAPFRYRHYGDLATIGRKSAIVSIGKLRLTGFSAWIFWSVAHIYFLIGARQRLTVALDWLWDYVTYQRGARLINEPLRRAAPARADTSSASE